MLHREVFYSKRHVDAAKGIAEPVQPEYYTVAEAIRCLRVTSLINEKFDFLDHDKMRGDFLAYFRKMCRKKYEKWDTVYRHFSNFVGGHCTFGDITVATIYSMSDKRLRIIRYPTGRGLREVLLTHNVNTTIKGGGKYGFASSVR